GLSGAASVATGTGTLRAGNITTNLQANTLGSLTPVSVSGNLALNNASFATVTRTITTADSIADVDSTITAKITDGEDNTTFVNETQTLVFTGNITGGQFS